MKKHVKLIVIIIASLTLLAACSSQSQKKKSNSKDSSAQSETASTDPVNSAQIDLAKLYGNWESEGESDTYYISIKKSSDNSLEYADNLEGKDSRLLTIDTNSGDTITALTEDKANRYQFVFTDDKKITAFYGVNTELDEDEKSDNQLVGLSKPIVYRKIDKQ